MSAHPTPRFRKCPICGKAATDAARPFCSAACKSLDLHRWLAGTYTIPASETDDEEDDRPEE